MTTLFRYALSLALIAVATVVAFACAPAVDARSLALVYVVPVALSAAWWGWGPSLTSAVLGVFVFEFFFIPPRFSILVSSGSDLWALGLMLLVAAIVSSVSAQARQRAVEARTAADRAEALQGLAHKVIQARPSAELVSAAAEALHRMFKAPAAVFAESPAGITLAAADGGATVSEADREAAAWTLDSGLPSRAETYPFPDSSFDAFPVSSRGHGRFVLAVKFGDASDGRPADADRLLELAGGYLAAAPADAG